MDENKTKAKKNLRKRVSADQLEYILTYMEENPDLKNGILTPNFTKRDRRNKWEELSESLNALVGSVKTTDLWKKTWNDQKSYVRSKASRIIKGGSEDGSTSFEKLSPMEERILNLIGWTPATITRDSKVSETKVLPLPPDTKPVFSDEDSEFNEEATDTGASGSEEEAEFNEKVDDDDVPFKFNALPGRGCSSEPPPKKQRMTLCSMTAAALEELEHHGQLMARNAAVQEETLSVLKVISSSLQSISTNLRKIADVAVNRI